MEYIKCFTFTCERGWKYSFQHEELRGVRVESRADYGTKQEALKAMIDAICARNIDKPLLINGD